MANEFKVKNGLLVEGAISGSSGIFSGNVGIGTNSPSRKLEVYASSGDALIMFNRAGSYGWDIGIGGGSSLPTSYFGIYDASYAIARLVIAPTTGNVGIGTTTPLNKLVVGSTGVASAAIEMRNAASNLDNQFSSARILSTWTTTSYAGSRLDLQTATGENTWLTGLSIKAGNVGIGTASPGYPLEVVGSETALRVTGTNSDTAWSGRIVAGGPSNVFVMGQYDDKAWIGAHSASLSAWADFYINPDGTKKLFLGSYPTKATSIVTIDNATGNVGIGTTSPQGRLHIGATTYSTLNSGYKFNMFGPVNIMQRDNGTDSYIVNNAFFNSDNLWQRVLGGGAGRIGWNSDAVGAMDFKVAPTGTEGSTFSWVNAMTILGDGKVGIGTTTPAYKFTVKQSANGTAGIASLNSSGAYIHSLDSDGSGNGTLNVYDATSSQKISFNSVGASFFNGGNVGIGTPTPNGKLDVQGFTNAYSGLATGVKIGTILSASANSDVLTGLYVNPTFSNGAYSGVKNFSAVFLNGNVGIGTSVPLSKLQVGLDNAAEPVSMGSLYPQVSIFGAQNNTSADSVLRLIRPTYSGNSYPASVDFRMSCYGTLVTPYLPKTQLTIGLKATGNYVVDEVVNVLTLRDNGSVSHGTSTDASGSYSHAEGSLSTSKGASSHAEGEYTITFGGASHAEGYASTAIGAYSHAEGYNTTSVGNYSHSEGNTSKAVGTHSHAEGNSTTAVGNYSHTEGASSIARNSYEQAYSVNSGGQFSRYGLFTPTNSSSPVEMYITGTEEISIPLNSTSYIKVDIAVRGSSGSNVYAIYQIICVANVDSTFATANLVVNTNTAIYDPMAVWSYVASISTSTGKFRVSVTGDDDNDLNWYATVEINSVYKV